MKIKMKRKTSLTMFSLAFICLFTISFGLNVNAADDLVYDGVSYENKIEVQNLPITVSVLFTWDTGASVQKMDYVWLDYDTQKDIVKGEYRLTYDCYWEEIDLRPSIVLLTIPRGNLDENDTIYFKISYQWDKFGSQNMIEEPSAVHKVEIYLEGGIAEEEQDDLMLYIILGSAGAIVFIALFVMYTIRRRR